MRRPRALAAVVAALAALIGALPVSAAAQASTAPLLQLPASARGAALGGVLVALSDDDAALFANPAQLATIRHASASISAQRYLAGSTVAAVSGALRLGAGTLGAGVQLLDYGSEGEIIPDPSTGGATGTPTGGSVSAGDFVATVGYGASWRALHVGASAKLVSRRIADLDGRAAAADIGLGASFPGGGSIGVAVQNLGGSLRLGESSERLPTAGRVGALLPVVRRGALELDAAAVLVASRETSLGAGGGAELSWSPEAGVALVGRVGASSRDGASALSPLVLGGGLRTPHLALDYAYQGADAIGATHRLGVRWRP